ncbi:DUF4974 domain-containing protein [Chitinophaga agrisoli]|uniref:DUF4974 domain-containing protein n=1 Tax=Chitinophaga agrisoli TaxID=2607653 RepID=A0A5B2VQ59_9BACT|nr:FecR family protein [Chitinophaga agrisoli]KAA2241281.1 DUF4974 domain-containing protein [Chitinophaga agrisoli]
MHLPLEIADLVTKHHTGQLTEPEKAQLNAWITASPANRRLWEQLNDESYIRKQLDTLPDATTTAAAWQRLQTQLPSTRPRIGLRRYAAAAAILVLVGAATLFFLNRPATPPALANNQRVLPAPGMPGTAKARLILGNGSIVELKEDHEQDLTEQDGTQLKSHAAVLSYHNTAAAETPVFNTLQIPRGGEYRVVLPDSSVVWLNASTSLRFPTRFNGDTRNVYLTGEAYFEIAKDKSKPFIVHTDKLAVTVTGTKFNVKAYTDEVYTRTTLVEGGVRLTAGTNNVLLHPGEEGVWEQQHIIVQEAYMEEALAWKNGRFVFRSEPLGSIMRKLSRWYDIDVSFSGAALTELRFTGTIRKYESIQKVLDMLALTQKVQFSIDGKNVAVKKI